MFEVEIITNGGRQRRWNSAKKLRTVEETLNGSKSISTVARRNGLVLNLLCRCRKMIFDEKSVAVE